MEIKVLEEEKNRIKLQFLDEGHGFCNALKTELWNDSHVKIASYKIEHPLISKPDMAVETDGEEKPRAALLKAASRLKGINEKLKKDFSQEIKW